MTLRVADLLERNRLWAEATSQRDPEFFVRLARQQSPKFLWIGCSDSRVPATQITDLDPGEMFVHRNVANIVSPTDLNLLAVVQFALDVLGVGDVIVCGHHGCGGVEAVLDGRRAGLVDHWLHEVDEVREEIADELARLPDRARRSARLAEANVAAQVAKLCRTQVVRDAWTAGRSLAVHGWIYDIADGRLRDLGVTRTGRPKTP
ncbi:MAG: carbonic anhydrase [Acidobacteriota bacterium]